MPDRPNIVLVITDSQGWNAVGCGPGPDFAETPNVDALAADGVRFDRTYASAVPCTPSRAGLFTGRHAHDAGAWTNNTRLYKGVETMGQHLRRAGYRTANVGKWHLDGDYFGTGEAAPGYEPDYWYDGQNYREEMGEEFWEWYRAGMDTRVAENPIGEIHERGITREDTWAGNITDRALAFIEDARDDDRPFFLVVNYDEPHEPSLCPPPYCDRYRDRRYPLPDNYETVAELAEHGKPARQVDLAERYASGDIFMNSVEHAPEEDIFRPLYFGCVEFVDAEMGRVFDAVDPAETHVTFTADHGHYLGAHGLDLKHAPMYDEVTNVPHVARGPSLPTGEVSTSLLSHVDVLPTFLDLAGAESPDAVSGQSYLPTAREPARDHREEALVEYHSYGGGDFFPVRCLVDEAGYKLVINLLDTDEFYDLNDDPGELHNRIDAADSEAVRDDLHDRLLATMEATTDRFDGDAWADRPWRDAV
jgi:uncharacterized sulfatase